MEQKGQLLPEEVLHDTAHEHEFIAIREDKKDDGTHIGTIIAFGLIPDDVHAALKADQKKNPKAKYFFAKPMEEGSDVRQHYVVHIEE